MTGSVRPGVLNTARIAGIVVRGSSDDKARGLPYFLDASKRTGDATPRSWLATQRRAAPIGGSAPGHGALAADASIMGYGIHSLQNATAAQLDAVCFMELTTGVYLQSRARVRILAADPLSRAFLSCLLAHERLRLQDLRACFARYMTAPSHARAPFVGRRLHVAGRAGDGTMDRHDDNLVTASASGPLPA